MKAHGCYDSTGEELYVMIAAAAIERGYTCLTFEGPGQGALIREQHLPFRPEWEQVVTPVVDSLLRRPEVDHVIRKVMRRDPGIRWAIENGMFTFQVGSIWDLIEATECWSLEGIANTITCPTLV